MTKMADNSKTEHHSKTEHVRLSSPHCIYFGWSYNNIGLFQEANSRERAMAGQRPRPSGGPVRKSREPPEEPVQPLVQRGAGQIDGSHSRVPVGQEGGRIRRTFHLVEDSIQLFLRSRIWVRFQGPGKDRCRILGSRKLRQEDQCLGQSQ